MNDGCVGASSALCYLHCTGVCKALPSTQNDS